METTYTIIRPNGTEEQHTVDLPEQPEFSELSRIIRPILGKGRDLERVNVLHEGRYTDMFVDDCGVLDDLPLNAKASDIYNNNLRTHEPELLKLQGDGVIAGPAVLFARRVWF